MKWTQEELERLYQQATEKANADENFRREILADTKAALEKLAGRELPDDFNLKAIENDSGYAATYIVPDFVQGELDIQELEPEALEQASGGISFFAILSGCASAVSFGPCAADACAAAGCAANACAAAVCGGAACAGDACAANAGGGGACAAAACGADGCGANVGCAAYATGADACGANTGCYTYSSGASACGANVGCAANAGGISACGANTGCAANIGG